MDHSDHVALLRGGIPQTGGVWADLGSGRGAFTLALAELVGPQARIYSVDRDRAVLRDQARVLQERFPQTEVRMLEADFTLPLDLPPLDGLVIANALHFFPDRDDISDRAKPGVVTRLGKLLKPGGRLLLVEYNTNHGNPWVPYPLDYPTWEHLAGRCGLIGTRLLETRPSSFLKEFYSAVSRSNSP